MMPVTVRAPTILSHTSKRSTVMNLKSDVLRTGFRITANKHYKRTVLCTEETLLNVSTLFIV